MNLITIGPQGPAQIKQPQGFGPKVKGAKIPDIGIDQEDVRGEDIRKVQGIRFKVQGKAQGIRPEA